MSALRIARPGSPAVLLAERDGDEHLSAHQRHVLTVVRSYNGNRSRAARQLGVTVQSVQATLRVIERHGVAVPVGIVGRAGRPDLHRRVRR